jgi:hypothetical protein
MSEYGLRVLNSDGSKNILIPSIIRIIATGTLTMSNSLEADNTYGEDIDLSSYFESGESDIDVSEIGVIAYPTKVNWGATIASIKNGTSYAFSWYALDSYTYYTKNDTTGVMSVWTPGNMLINTNNNWDACCNAFPLAGWDYPVGTSRVSKVRIWGAMCYLVYDYSASQMQAVFSIGNKGVEKIDYIIFLKNH